MRLSQEDWAYFLLKFVTFVMESLHKLTTRSEIIITKMVFFAERHTDFAILIIKTVNINVVLHNFSSYDAHLLVSEIVNGFEGDVTLIPNNLEQYIALIKNVGGTRYKFTFIDSFKFMPSSLEKLASYLPGERKVILREHFPDESKFKLLTQKSIFCYNYIDSWKVLEEKKLPEIDKFYLPLSTD